MITKSALVLGFLVLLTLSASEVLYQQLGAGAITRDVQSHIRDLGFNVRDFGALGNGATNDTPAFRRAVAAAGVGGLILVPPGHYRVNGVVLLNRQHLLGLGGGGAGSLGVVLSRYSGAPIGISAAPGGAQRLNVSSIELKDYSIALDLRRVNYSYFSDLALTDNGRDIYLGGPGTIGNTLQHIRATGATARSIDCDISTPLNNINNNRFIALTLESDFQSIFAGIGGNGASGNSFIGCEFQGNGLWCRSVSGLEFGGCYFEGGPCIDLDDGCYGVSIHGSYFQNFAPAAIRIGYHNGANTGSGGGVDITANTFFNEVPNGIGVYLPSPNVGGVRIGNNLHQDGGHTSYVPIHDLNNIAIPRAPILAPVGLPLPGGAHDGKVVIENAGANDGNLIIYVGGQRFRINGGSAF